jgi:hypothetical protein
METSDHSKKIFYLLAAGALLVMLAGGLTGIAKRSSAVPREDISSHERSFELLGNKLSPALGPEKGAPMAAISVGVSEPFIPPSAAGPSSPDTSLTKLPLSID